MNPDEKRIWNRIKKGDEVAFRDLFDRHYSSLCYTANRLVNNREVAQDMAQEAFVELWKRREKLNIDFSIWGYLKRATINKSLNYIKSQKRIVSMQTEQGEMDVVQELPNNSNLERQELVEIVRNTINKLPERCKEVFLLRRYEEKSYREIAEMLSISERTVEVQLRKARKFLLKELTPYRDILTIFLSIFMIIV